jgi:hypothetical protein
MSVPFVVSGPEGDRTGASRRELASAACGAPRCRVGARTIPLGTTSPSDGLNLSDWIKRPITAKWWVFELEG